MHTLTPPPGARTQGLLGEAVVDLDAIAHNVRVLAEHAGSAQVMAVVKADGYGHGAVQVARAAVAAGAAELGVATLDEALALRAGGITAPVLAWLHRPGTDFAPALTADVQVAVSSSRQLAEVLDAAHRTGRPATVTVKADTGMNRNGVTMADYPALLGLLRRAVADEAVRPRALMSHLACADQPDHPANDLQAQRFAELLAQAREQGVRFEVAHLANSSAVLTRPDLAYDLVRPGIAVYGLNPIPEPGGSARLGEGEAKLGPPHGPGGSASRDGGEVKPGPPHEPGDFALVPAMTLKSVVVLMRSIRAGDGVSYGHTWVAEADTTLALLPIGYADGVFRALSGRFDVLINGRRRAAVGRVCMDQFVVDLGPGPVDVAEGDEAILFGPGQDGEPTAQDWADALGTVHYEVVTSPRGRVSRTYRAGSRAQ